MHTDGDLIAESGIVRLSDADWAKARQRAAVIGPLAERDIVPSMLAAEAASRLGITERTIYKLVRRWRESGGSVIALAPTRSSGGKGGTRLCDLADQIIASAITKHYLTRQRVSLSALMTIVREECRRAGVPTPSLNTVRARIDQLRPDKVVRRRHGKDAARRLQPVEGRFPNVFCPLEAVQIDHTRVDLIVVDAYTRQPIGRPWITVAIDVYSRCIIGFCLTLDPPSAVSVGLCLVHAAIDKRPWLERIGVDSEWPMAGKPKVIHVDNGADFHSEALRRGCETHGIRIVYRPPGAPHYGGIVERVIGTFMNMVHQLPGTTFSNISDRGDYDSEQHAVMTLAELEKWFALAITGPYHSGVHSGLGEPPKERWQRATEEAREVGCVRHPKAFLVDFLPIIRRKVQRQGFVIDRIVYLNNAIKPWITELDRGHRFVIRRDPRDLSRIFVLHPEESHYVEVPYRSMSQPAITLWEHRRAVEHIRQQGRAQVDEDAIFRAAKEMRTVTEKAIAATKAARRSVARRAHLPQPAVEHNIGPPIQKSAEQSFVKPFDDIEFW